MKITSLVENTTSINGIGTEHGLSLYIESNDYKILFDMGQTNLFERNAALLGIDLKEVDFVVLSHGHYDHGGGLKRFLEINDSAMVYLSSNAFGQHYHGKMKYIGLDQSLRKNKRLCFLNHVTEIVGGAVIFPYLKVKKQRADFSGLTRKEGEEFLEEDFRHELYLMIEENGKKVLFSGCSHRGILDITEEFTPDFLIGGFHFSKLPLEDGLKNASKVLNCYPTTYFTCHCTGVRQYEFMKEEMKNLYYISAGKCIEI